MDQQLKWRVVRRLRTHLRAVKWSFAASLVLLLLVAAMTAVKAGIIQPVVDGFLDQGATPDLDKVARLPILCGIVAGIFVLQAVLNWAYLVVARQASAGMVKAIRRDLFHQILRQNLGYFASRPSSDLTSRIVNDVTAFEDTAVRAVQNLLRDIATVILLLGVMLYHDAQLALVCLGIVGVVGWILRIMSRHIRAISRQIQDALSRVVRQLTETIGGVELVLSFGLGKRLRQRFEEVNEENYRAQVRGQVASATGISLVAIVVALGLAGIFYLTGSATLEKRITFGACSSILGALYLMQVPAVSIGDGVAFISRGMAAAARAFELFDDEPDVVDPVHPVPLPDPKGAVRFAEVSFSYGTAPVVSRLSFAIEPGELVVMVGDSGAGKSTIAKLLLRFYDPQEGRVLVDGVNIRDLSRETLHRNLSYVGQEVFLFDGSIDFNLRIGKPDATEAEIAEALRVSCLDDFVAELPDGIHTLAGERGVRLSGGQRQRIAIARAVLTSARILVLDEATSALDMELEQRILERLVNTRGGRTVFAVTHRLSLAEIADRVMVLRDGMLVEEGSAQELAAGNGEYARLQRAAQGSAPARNGDTARDAARDHALAEEALPRTDAGAHRPRGDA